MTTCLVRNLVAFLSFSLLPLASAQEPSPPRHFYVSPLGNDQWSGTKPDHTPGSTSGPLASIQRALELSRTAKTRSAELPVTIHVRGGTYHLNRPITLFPEDSHVSIVSFPHEQPLISGGKPVSGWRTATHKGYAIWVAKIPRLDDHLWRFVEFWTANRRAVRARHPNTGYLSIEGLPDKTAEWTEGQFRFEFAKGDLPRAEFLSDVEAVVMTRWVESRLPLISVDYSDRLLTFGKRSVFQLSKGDLYYLEGSIDFLDTPGEWALDSATDQLFYFPFPEERLDDFVAVAPALTQVVRLEGNPEQGKFIQDVHFQGLTFSHAEWYYPGIYFTSRERPRVWLSNAETGGFSQAAIGVPGAVWGAGVRSSSFERCKFTNLGAYGLELGRGCSSNRIADCEFSSLGAGGIKIGETVLREHPNDFTQANLVADCRIMDGGKLFHSAVGLWLGQSSNNRIVHNLIQDFYYTGISIGWTWGYGNATATNNLVAQNYVRYIGRRYDGDGPILSDMGGIYTLSRQPGTRILNNLWHDISGFKYGGWGIYFDEGSSSIVAKSNLVYNTTHGGFHQHYGATNIVRNNIFALSRDHQVQRSRQEEHISFLFQTNIVFFNNGVALGSNWSDDMFRLSGNLYFDSRVSNESIPFPGGDFQKWRARGHDAGSRVADPRFVAPHRYDFRLHVDSPAFGIGFQPLDLSRVGPWQGFFSPYRDKPPIPF